MIQLKNIERSYKTGAGQTWVLGRVNLDVQPGRIHHLDEYLQSWKIFCVEYAGPAGAE